MAEDRDRGIGGADGLDTLAELELAFEEVAAAINEGLDRVRQKLAVMKEASDVRG